MKKFSVLLIGIMLMSACSAAPAARDTHVGFWHMVADEDNGPLGEILEFRANGEYVFYDQVCAVFQTFPYHVHNGDMYVTIVVPGKGPIALVFHPEPDDKLSYTSPRTQTGLGISVYRKASALPAALDETMATNTNKTQATAISADSYFSAIADEERRSDCKALAALMTRVTKQPPVMWGSSIVGFGSYHYRYDSGREGDMCVVGFSSRKGDISVYLTNLPDREEFLAKLGKHKAGKGCLYLRKLTDVDLKVLEKMIAASVAATKQRYG
jgi:hypothetical protein